MSSLAVGRKNFVVFGSHKGASLGACAYTVVESCKFNTISAYEYIKRVLTLIGDEKEDTNDYFALLRVFWLLNNTNKLRGVRLESRKTAF
jgi:hypothetical protein